MINRSICQFLHLNLKRHYHKMSIFYFLIINSSVVDLGYLSKISDPDIYPSRTQISDTRSRIQHYEQRGGGNKTLLFYLLFSVHRHYLAVCYLSGTKQIIMKPIAAEPILDPGSRIQDPKTATKERGEKKLP